MRAKHFFDGFAAVASVLALVLAWGDRSVVRSFLRLDYKLPAYDASSLLALRVWERRILVASGGEAPEVRLVSKADDQAVVHARQSLLARTKVSKGRQPRALAVDDGPSAAAYIVLDSWIVRKTDAGLTTLWESALDSVPGQVSDAATCNRTLIVLSNASVVVGVDSDSGSLLWTLRAQDMPFPRPPPSGPPLAAAVDVALGSNHVRVACRTGEVGCSRFQLTRTLVPSPQRVAM
jgi:hypothetical protein